MSRIAPAALDRAAVLIGRALGVAEVARDPLGPDAGSAESAVDGTALVVALSEASPPIETGYCMGAPDPYELQLDAALEILATGGDEAARRARREEAICLAQAALETDPTLGGLVDLAELTSPDPSDEERYAGLAAVLTLTYTAPNALG